jgi:hypothetical protein
MKANASIFRPRKPGPTNWRVFSIGRSGFVISATISTEKQRIGVELYMENDVDKSAFRALQSQKDVIEGEFGEPLKWEELPGKKATRIVLYRYDVDPSDEKQYADLHRWMLDKMERFKRVFGPRVKALPAASVSGGGEDDEAPEE